MLARLALLFVVVPLIELALLVELGGVVGLLPTVLLVVTTGILGAALARREGLRVLTAVRSELADGRVPGGALMHGLSVLVGGALLLTPGLLTDLVGFSLLIPPTRSLILRGVRRWFERQLSEGRVQFVSFGTPGGPGAPGGASREEADLDPEHEIRGG